MSVPSGDSNAVKDDKNMVVLANCQGGIGIKIVGGKTSSGPSYGIFIKKTILGSPAERNGSLREGDKILKVNNEDLSSVSNERAMSVLLNASKAGVVSFLVERNDASYHEYRDLMGSMKNGVFSTSYGNFSQTPHLQGPVRASSSTVEKRSWILAGGRMSPMSSGHSSPRNSDPKSDVRYVKEGDFAVTSERPLSLAESNGDSGLHSSSSTLYNFSNLSIAHITLTNGLGISITGGVNHPDGPSVIVKELVNGGDVDSSGKIKQGDQIVSINGESFLNITHEEAKMKITQVKLRAEKDLEITYISKGRLGIDRDRTDLGEDGRLVHQLSSVGRLTSQSTTLPVGCSHWDHNMQDFSRSLKSKSMDKNANYTPTEIHHSPFPQNDAISSLKQSSIQPSSIPYYLQQDLAASPKLNTTNGSLTSDKLPSRLKKSPRRRLSLAPTSKMRVEKLEVALNYLGINLTPEQQERIRRRLQIDPAGLVSYGEFVDVAQEILHHELDHNHTFNRGNLQFALHDIQENGVRNSVNHDVVLDHPVLNLDDKVIEELTRQRDDAIAKAEDLQRLLDEKKNSYIAETKQLEGLKRTAAQALEESMALKDQVFLATQAKIAADRKDEEYEEVIRLLEDELRILKAKGTPKQQEFLDLQKKVVVLGCQLRKMEVVKRTYEVATKKLLNFADSIQDCLKKSVIPASSYNASQNEGNFVASRDAPSYSFHKSATQKLAEEARDVAHSVRVLLEEEPLPFGWEEAYTSEGERYFINHVTQMTSWLHPVTHTTKMKADEI